MERKEEGSEVFTDGESFSNIPDSEKKRSEVLQWKDFLDLYI